MAFCFTILVYEEPKRASSGLNCVQIKRTLSNVGLLYSRQLLVVKKKTQINGHIVEMPGLTDCCLGWDRRVV